MLVNIAFKSLLNRKGSVLLTLFTLILSILVLITVEDIRQQSKQSFNRAISGVDLIVGAPTGQLNLTLASVFGIGYLTNPVDWSSFEKLKKHPQVKWALPISLGDSHKGKRVIGTESNYFELVKYGSKQDFSFAHGQSFIDDAYTSAEVVIGAKVASEFGYQLNNKLVLSHGLGVTSFQHHDQVKFNIVGILDFTGTPTDNALFVSLSGIERMHDDSGHVHSESTQAEEKHRDEHEHEHEHSDVNAEQARAAQSAHSEHAHDSEQVSAILIGVKAKYATLMVQKYVNDFAIEPLMAVIPGVALSELWRLLSTVESLLLIISSLVLVSSLFGMCAMLLSSMRERVKEIAVFRALGAGKSFVFWLIQLEVLMLTVVASSLALLLGYFSHWLLQPILLQQFGIAIEATLVTEAKMQTLVIVILAGIIAALIPAGLAYKKALSTSLKQ